MNVKKAVSGGGPVKIYQKKLDLLCTVDIRKALPSTS